jgi:hypothetical protein
MIISKQNLDGRTVHTMNVHPVSNIDWMHVTPPKTRDSRPPIQAGIAQKQKNKNRSLPFYSKSFFYFLRHSSINSAAMDPFCFPVESVVIGRDPVGAWIEKRESVEFPNR